MKETMKMIQILDKRKREAQMRAERERLIIKQKEAQKKEQLHMGIAALIAFILLVVIVILGHNYLENEYNKCMASGKSETTCNAIRSIDK